jgi:DNA-binding NarL/FixJ family response regulator
MKVLIVEDDEFKLTQLARFVALSLPDARIVERRSYQSGMKEALEGSPDVILLDMNLPNFDITATEGGYETLFFAGRDILLEIKRLLIPSLVIVVTQFDTFGEGPEATTLEELKQRLAEQFPQNYLETIYYHPAQEDWKTKLSDQLKIAAHGKK